MFNISNTDTISFAFSNHILVSIFEENIQLFFQNPTTNAYPSVQKFVFRLCLHSIKSMLLKAINIYFLIQFENPV